MYPGRSPYGWPSYQNSGLPQPGRRPPYEVPRPLQSGLHPSQVPGRQGPRGISGTPPSHERNRIYMSGSPPKHSRWGSESVGQHPSQVPSPRVPARYTSGGTNRHLSSPCLNSDMAITSDTIMRRFESFYYFECQEKWLYNSQLDDVIPALLATCKSFGVSACDEPSCTENLEMFGKFVPQSQYFPCLRRWVMQVVACQKSRDQAREPFPLVAKGLGSCFDRRQADPEPLVEVLSLLSWFNGYFNYGGGYEAISPPAPLRLLAKRDTALIESYGAKSMREEIDKAVERVKAYEICLRRAWVVVSYLPGRELNLPALIPKPDSPVVHSYLSHGPEHANCTRDHCEQIRQQEAANKAMHPRKRYVDQLHVSDGCDCELTEEGMFPTRKLLDAIKQKQLTAWSLDGRRVFGGDAYNRDFSNVKEPFIAISHVWADGTGAGDPDEMQGRVRSCLFNMFCNIAEELDCRGVWWDAICIPEAEEFREHRRESLKFMEKNYSAAKYTVIHDLYLRNMPWIDAESACLALVLSSWFTRGWTALELVRSDNIYVIFADSDDPNGYILKNLDDDILIPNRVGGTACQLVTRAIIQAFRKKSRAQRNRGSELVYRKIEVNDILISLSGRSTSWIRDRPIIASFFAEIDLPPYDPNKPEPLSDPHYCRRVLQGRSIKAENLFHMAMPARGFGWQPTSFFDLPVSLRNDSSMLRIPTSHGRCDVVGRWAFICDPSRNADLRAFRGVRFDWSMFGEDKGQVGIKTATTNAIRSTRHHVILIDANNDSYPSRGILVKVKRWSTGTMQPSNVQAIFGAHRWAGSMKEQRASFPCEFVAVVHFSSSELPITSPAYFVLLGTDNDSMVMDLDLTVSAGFFIKSSVRDVNSRPMIAASGFPIKHDDLESMPIFSPKSNVGRWSDDYPEENIWEEESSIPDILRIPRMQQARFDAGRGSSELALPGCDEVQLTDPRGLLISANRSLGYNRTLE